ncbi:helicase associated domain-containing protein [Streptomyces mayonensis]|uniref:helicase associated domain-containing protein n=1 Tax=Streptomyces mayonensis TaxID=2750816 RepID=UPI0027E4E683|nr:helicase associated domain-containing protein [Streptomyces sp. A108]
MDAAFNRGLCAARQYHLRSGHLDVPKDHTEEVFGDYPVDLGAWLARRRRDSAQVTPAGKRVWRVWVSGGCSFSGVWAVVSGCSWLFQRPCSAGWVGVGLCLCGLGC